MTERAGTALECDAILFDMDGVLVDSRGAVDRLWRRFAATHHLDPEYVLLNAHGRPGTDTVRIVTPHLDPIAEGQAIDDAWMEDLADMTAMPGAVEMLRMLPDDRWTIVTASVRRLTLRRLQWIGLPVPPALVSSEDVARGKPAPDGYLAAARALGISPARCLVVEDAPAGIAAGRAAGMPVLALATTHDAGHLGGATAIVRDLRDVTVEIAGAHLRLHLNHMGTGRDTR